MKFIYKLLIVLTIIIILILMFPIKANTNEITLPEPVSETVVEPMYYQPADLIDEYLGEDGIYHITFIMTENENDGNIYLWDSEGILPDDIPYLLCMDSNGTEDITDDEILVVWGCMN